MRHDLLPVIPELVAVLHILKRETGQGLIEYALLAAFIAVTATTMLSGIGATIADIYTEVASEIAPVAVSPSPRNGPCPPAHSNGRPPGC